MGYDVYIDGECADRFNSASAWEEAAIFIEKNTPANTALRRLAESGETHRPQQAAAALSDLLEHRQPVADVARTLRHVHSLLKLADHVLITDGVIDKEP